MKAAQANACPACNQPYPIRNGHIIKAIPHVTPILDGSTANAYYPALMTCRKCGRPAGVPRPSEPAPRPAIVAHGVEVGELPNAAQSIVGPAAGKARKRAKVA